MRIYLVRHAQVKSNLKGIAYNNQKRERLTKEGKLQAKKIAQRLNKVKFDKIYISEYKRTYQTILPLLKLQPISYKEDKRLNECRFGIFSGLTLKEAKEKYPEIFEKRWKDKWNIPIPKGESFKDVAHRWNLFLNDLKKEVKKFQFKNILIITHATNLKVFLIKYLRFSVKKADSIYFENTSVSVFDFQNGKIKPIAINDYIHLKYDTNKDKRIYSRKGNSKFDS